MLDFRKPEISDKQWVDECLKHAFSMNCEYTFGNLYIWSRAYSTLICHYKNFLICRWGEGDDILYSLPIGEGNFSQAIEEMIKDAESLGVKLTVYGITEGYLGLMQEAFTGKFTYRSDDGYNDYIYSVDKMASLRGKKYHSKRNHITNFKKNNPDWSFEKINKNNINDCIALHEKWIKQKNAVDNEDMEEYSLEFEALLCALENFDVLGFTGGIIRVDGEAVAYTLGERQSDNCFVTHFEKALSEIQGSYAIINQEFTKNCLSDYEYVNREEDLGVDGLRKAKQSYYPEIFLEKCVAVYND